jgi:hypothetical protein
MAGFGFPNDLELKTVSYKKNRKLIGRRVSSGFSKDLEMTFWTVFGHWMSRITSHPLQSTFWNKNIFT